MHEFKTTGQIATALGVLHHRIIYAIRTRRLQPTARVGQIRLFSPSDIRVISDVLAQIEEAGNGRPAGCEREACVAEN